MKIVLPRLCDFVVIAGCLAFYLSGNIHACGNFGISEGGLIFANENATSITPLPARTSRLFDGKRKGFILGIGIQPQIYLRRSDSGSADFYRTSFDLQIRTGYGFSEQLLLLSDVSRYNFGVTFYEYGDRIDRFGGSVGVMYFPISGLDLYLRNAFNLSGDRWRYNTNVSQVVNTSVMVGIEGGIGYEPIPHVTLDFSLDLSRQWQSRDDLWEDPSDNAIISITLTGLFY